MESELGRPRGRRRRPAAALVSASALALAAAGLAAAPAASVAAHAEVAGSTPEDGATVATPPDQVSLVLDAMPATVEGDPLRVYAPDGRRVDANDVRVDAERRTVTVTLDHGLALPSGEYQVAYRVVSADTHLISGRLTFSARAPAGGTAPAAGAAPGGDAGSPAAPDTRRLVHGWSPDMRPALVTGGALVTAALLLGLRARVGRSAPAPAPASPGRPSRPGRIGAGRPRGTGRRYRGAAAGMETAGSGRYGWAEAVTPWPVTWAADAVVDGPDPDRGVESPPFVPAWAHEAPPGPAPAVHRSAVRLERTQRPTPARPPARPAVQQSPVRLERTQRPTPARPSTRPAVPQPAGRQPTQRPTPAYPSTRPAVAEPARTAAPPLPARGPEPGLRLLAAQLAEAAASSRSAPRRSPTPANPFTRPDRVAVPAFGYGHGGRPVAPLPPARVPVPAGRAGVHGHGAPGAPRRRPQAALPAGSTGEWSRPAASGSSARPLPAPTGDPVTGPGPMTGAGASRWRREALPPARSAAPAPGRGGPPGRSDGWPRRPRQ